MMKVSVIVPTLNEAVNLPAVVEQVAQGLADANLSYEIIIVDDASTDGTPQVARDLAARWPVRLIERQAETGLSTAVVAGMNQAAGEVFAILDADGSHPPDHVALLAQCILQHQADAAIGSRYVTGGQVADAWPATRQLTSRLASMAARPLVQASDPLAGMFAISRSLFDEARPRIRPCGFKILLEILAAVRNPRIAELPIHFALRRAGQSKLTASVAQDYLRQLIRLYYRHYRRGIFSRRRTPSSFTGVGCHMSVSLGRREVGARHAASSRKTAAQGGGAGLAQRPSNSRPDRRAGFTIVELLAVVAIIGLLVALLLPAVQAAREAARRATCASKLRNLALAVHNYHEATSGYPRNRFKVPEDVGPDGQAWSWIVRVLPFIEQQALYDELHVRRAALGEKQELIAQPLDFLFCPTDGEPRSRLSTGHFEDMLMGVTNYKAVCGSNWGADETQDLDDIGSLWRNIGFHGSFDGQAHGDGIMWRDDYVARMRAAKITDGLSKTFLLGEDLPTFNAWNSWAYNTNTFGTCAIPPNKNDVDPSWWPNSMGFRSAHNNGLLFSHADGSVVLVRNSIEESIYRRKATRRDGRSNDN